jgi:membrane associated rhomboid family serine protease
VQTVIPISDDNPGRTVPIVTWAIIAGCVAAYLWERSLGGQIDAALTVLGFVPASLSAGHGAPPQGYVDVSPIATIFTSMFLHGGLLHLGGNMLYLWIFGNNVEDAMGHVRYAVFYLLSGVAAALTMALIDPHSQIPMVGASGAISGILASYVLLWPRARVTVIVPLGIIFYPMAVSAMWVVGFWFVLQLLSALLTDAAQPGVAFWAHVGGFIVGAILTPFLKSAQYRLFGEVYRGPWRR